ncbi:MAG TPA: hypothetical protein VFC93_11910 [Chloroflexota bacterium]|nr:hypothetical protein [Chloroflexota bacterium]
MRAHKTTETAAGPTKPRRRTVATQPLSAYELVTRRAVEDLERELGRIDAKVNALVVGMVATLVAEVWRAFLKG